MQVATGSPDLFGDLVEQGTDLRRVERGIAEQNSRADDSLCWQFFDDAVRELHGRPFDEGQSTLDFG
ncbi:MAG: hypothetical protein L0L36_09640, partial [Brevibacterium sp.]|nr:hypothetical protein [Brevibacterium sp.]